MAVRVSCRRCCDRSVCVVEALLFMKAFLWRRFCDGGVFSMDNFLGWRRFCDDGVSVMGAFLSWKISVIEAFLSWRRFLRKRSFM